MSRWRGAGLFDNTAVSIRCARKTPTEQIATDQTFQHLAGLFLEQGMSLRIDAQKTFGYFVAIPALRAIAFGAVLRNESVDETIEVTVVQEEPLFTFLPLSGTFQLEHVDQ